MIFVHLANKLSPYESKPKPYMGNSGFSGPKQKQTKIKDLNFEQNEPKIF